MPARSGLLPPLAPRTPEQRVEARLQRVLREPRGASRGGGVLLRSELAAQDEGLARENEALRTQLAQSEEKRQACEAKQRAAAEERRQAEAHVAAAVRGGVHRAPLGEPAAHPAEAPRRRVDAVER